METRCFQFFPDAVAQREHRWFKPVRSRGIRSACATHSLSKLARVFRAVALITAVS